jgi:GWxTD domain-containing protein
MFALLLLTLLAPAPTFAQRDLALLHDSLQRIDNPSVLRGMIAQRADKRAPRSPELLTERGLIGLRLYEITSARPDGKTAQRAFEEALRTAPEYGWAHFGLGKVLAHGPDSNPFAGGIRNSFVLDDAVLRVFGNDAPSRARRAFLNAVNGTPPVAYAAAELAELSTRRWSHETLERSAAALAELNQTANANADSWLAYARVQLELGSVDAAVTSLERAVERGVDRAQGARTLAMVLFQSEKMEKNGAAAWFEAVDHAGDEVLQLLFEDVIALLSKPEIARWEKLSIDEKRNALRNFWDMRAALGGVPVHERMAEHYRRLQIARRQYWRSARFGAPKGNQLLLRSFGERPYDDRGMIFIRHGRPEQLLRASGPDNPRESWLYRNIDGQPRMLHFEAMQSSSDFDLVHMLPCDADYADPRRANDINVRRIMGCDQLNIMATSANYRQQAFEYLATDSDAPNFVKDLPFYFDLYTFRGDEGRTNVVAAVAVPVEKLQKTDAANNPAYRVDLSLILVDTASRKVIRQDDSVALGTTRAFRGDDLFRMHVEVAVPPSRTTLQRVIVSDPSEPGIGQLYGGPFLIPDYSPGKLMMSDIVLAEPRVEGRWHRGNVKLALVPTGRFKGGSFKVFYELYNIEKNSAYTTEIEIEPIQRSPGQRFKDLFGTKSKISLKFDGVAMDVQNGALQELRQVEAPLPEGRYRMRITVRNANGETVRGERIFVVPE